MAGQVWLWQRVSAGSSNPSAARRGRGRGEGRQPSRGRQIPACSAGWQLACVTHLQCGATPRSLLFTTIMQLLLADGTAGAMTSYSHHGLAILGEPRRSAALGCSGLQLGWNAPVSRRNRRPIAFAWIDGIPRKPWFEANQCAPLSAVMANCDAADWFLGLSSQPQTLEPMKTASQIWRCDNKLFSEPSLTQNATTSRLRLGIQ